MSDTDHVVPLMRPVLPRTEAVAHRLDAMHDAGWFTNFGPQSRELERRVADRLDTSADRVVSVANATLGLAGAVAVAEATRWRLPAWTFSATAAAVLVAGVTARFGDVDETDWWLAEETDSDESEGVLRVAPYGAAVTPQAWHGTTDVVIDAAASLGHDGMSLRDLPKRAAVVFSLGATKVLGAGEGGVAVFGDENRAAKFRAWTNFGFTRGRDSGFPGLNAKLSEPAAVHALAALDDWELERKEWLSSREVADQVTAATGLLPAPGLTGVVSPYWVVRFPDRETRQAAERILADHRVATRRWWNRGCHRMTAYTTIGRTGLPVTDRLVDTVLGLPMYRGLSNGDARQISSALHIVQTATTTQ